MILLYDKENGIEENKNGIVIKGHGKNFIVRVDSSEYSCEIRGKIKFSTKMTTPVAVGDDVLISISGPKHGMIEKVGERRTMFFRPSKTSDKKKQVIASNIDQMAAVASVKSPEIKPGLIDRIIIASEIGGLSPIIIINKIDLGESPLLNEIKSAYSNIHIPIFFVSAETGEGIEPLEEALKDHMTIFAGHSGVGKSTLLNHMIPGLDLRVADVSEYSNRGVHTTTHVELFAFPRGGYVVDSPGLKILGLWDLSAEQLHWYYPEMEEMIGNCRFTGCSHIHEPDCVIKDAVEAGDISQIRYDNYCTIYKSLKNPSQY